MRRREEGGDKVMEKEESSRREGRAEGEERDLR